MPAQRGTHDGDQRLSRASAVRFSLYLRCLDDLGRHGVGKVSSNQLGKMLGVSDAQVRKDLTWLGKLGQPGIGYSIPDLMAALRHALGIDRAWRAVLVGVGNLARALLRYKGFREHGFEVVGLFDVDPQKVGQMVEGLEVHGIEALAERMPQLGAELAILTVPAEAAQGAADELVRAGIRGILNFAPTLIQLPETVKLVSVDLTVQLEQLAFLVQMTSPATT